MRYSIEPISEAIIDNAFTFITDKDNKTSLTVRNIFDSNSQIQKMFRFQVPKGFQSLFDDRLSRLDDQGPETEFASAYYLYRMRRWMEALAVASSVVDRLTTELVHTLIQADVVAESVLRANRCKELFTKIFPALGKHKAVRSGFRSLERFYFCRRGSWCKSTWKKFGTISFGERKQS